MVRCGIKINLRKIINNLVRKPHTTLMNLHDGNLGITVIILIRCAASYNEENLDIEKNIKLRSCA